ncbi:MAG: FtsQ-type POTRA domain-containing protein [Terriglobales bacterium]|jgi:cell division protein FtsQ
MARKSGSTITQEELYPQSDEVVRDEMDDARLLDLDAEVESPFLRGQKRISVRRGTLPKKTASRLLWTAAVLTVVAVCGTTVAAVYQYGEHSWRFRVESSDDIEVGGFHNVTRSQVIEVMGGDIGRNIFFVPLDQRQEQLQQIPWIESASVMRFVPNRLRIEIHERTPVAFIRVGSKIMLTDASGALMELPPPSKGKYSFPVIVGASSGEPPSTRAARMKIYNQVVDDLDSDGGKHSQDLSEVDLSDPEDVKIVPNDSQGDVLVHLGSSNYLDRYKIYQSHIREWRQQFSKLESVDLRYDNQIIVNPDMQGAPKPPPLSAAASRAAMSFGVKQAALVNRQIIAGTEHPSPTHVIAAKASSTNVKAPTAHKTVRKNTKLHAHKKPAPRVKQVSASASSANQVSSQVSTKTGTAKPSPAIAKGQD